MHDNPIDAGRALEEAELYPRVAPSSTHAAHMASHLWLRIGDLSAAAVDNRAWFDGSAYDFHNLEFLHYVHLNLGQLTEAANDLNIVRGVKEQGQSPFILCLSA